MSHKAMALMLVTLLSVLGAALSLGLNTCATPTTAGPPTCFLDSSCRDYDIATRQLTVNNTANAASVSIKLSGNNYTITYAFTAFKPIFNQTYIQLNILENSLLTQNSATAERYDTWAVSEAISSCNSQKNYADAVFGFVFLWGVPLDAYAISTQPSLTSVVYTNTTAVITLPVADAAYLPWTATAVNKNGSINTTALCPGTHGNLLDIYLISGIYSQVNKAEISTRLGSPHSTQY